MAGKGEGEVRNSPSLNLPFPLSLVLGFLSVVDILTNLAPLMSFNFIR